MAEYNDAPRVRDMAESLIGKHHAHLKDARIAYVMKEGEVGKKITETSKGKRRKVAKARRQSEQLKLFEPAAEKAEVPAGVH